MENDINKDIEDLRTAIIEKIYSLDYDNKELLLDTLIEINNLLKLN